MAKKTQSSTETREIPEGFHVHANGGGLVADAAEVDASAYIGANAQVSGEARVYGEALVYGNALVSGDAQVSGDAWESSPLYIQGSRHALTHCASGSVQIGCHVHEIEYWLKHYRAIGRAEQYTAQEIAEYGVYLKLFKAVDAARFPK